MRSRFRFSILPLLAVSIAASVPSSLAHEFWIEPKVAKPGPSALIAAHLKVGDPFNGDPMPRRNDLIERFELIGGSGSAPLAAPDGSEPAGYGRLDQLGAALLVYLSKPIPHQLAAQPFEQYLRDKGLLTAIEERVRRGESTSTGRETFTRCAKALIGPILDRPVGLPLELLAHSVPVQGKPLQLQLLWDGRPLAGARLELSWGDDPNRHLSFTTDSRGNALVPIDRQGAGLFRAIQIRRHAGGDAEWDSFWASLWFQVVADGLSPKK